MRQEIKEKWVTALRSGEYKQGREYLKTLSGENTYYCCLGVLCELALKEGVNLTTGKGCLTDDTFTIHYNGESTSPSGTVLQWADLPLDGEIVNDLIQKNDVDGESFDQIADYIEAEL